MSTIAGVRAGLRTELMPMLRLAAPVAAGELGWMAMGLVDLMVVGRVSAEAIGAVSIGSNIFYIVAIFGMGMLLGLDYVVASAVGAARLHDAHTALVQGLYLSAALAVVLSAALFAALDHLSALGIDPAIAQATRPYLHALTWSMGPLLLYAPLRRYLQALGLVTAIMVALVTANAINAAVNWVLVFGHCGAPALGAAGSGWATCASRVYLLAFLAVYVVRHERRRGTAAGFPWAFDRAALSQVVRLGIPAALQMMLEVGVFGTASVLVGRLTASQLAAHQIALSAAAFAFMVPLGISSAAAVRVGHASGRRDPPSAARAGWTALLLGGAFMCCSASAFLLVPRWIIRVFTADPQVTAVAVSLLAIAAIFQLFDGLQVVATGALRGAGETRIAMLVTLAGYWLLALPFGYALCFHHGYGVVGLWIGLCTGVIAVAGGLVGAWWWRTRTR
jgi:MATE family multidrug resistance protein